MIYRNFELYNIAEMIPEPDGGYLLSRVPQYVREKMGDQGQRMVTATGGAEFRFVLNSGKAEITLKLKNPGATFAVLYYGGVLAGWQTFRQIIYDHPTTITIGPPDNPGMLRKISGASGYAWQPNVCRLVLESNQLVLLDVKGDVRPPREDETPPKRFMMYGSSITHGSLACTPNMTFLSQISRRLNADFYSYGFAGACRLEKEVCDYISEQDNEINPRRWDFAVMELGINILGMADDEFERRVRYLFDVMRKKNPDKKLFATDIFYFSGDLDGHPKADGFREIVRKAAGDRDVFHIPGRSILTSARGLSGDFTHPNVDGVCEIAQNLGRVLEENT